MFLLRLNSFRILRLKDYFILPFRAFCWWYTEGLKELLSFVYYQIRLAEDTFSLFIMLKHLLLLHPLHQDFTIIGRGIGIVFRLLWVSASIFILTLYSLLLLFSIVIWLFTPFYVFAQFFIITTSLLGYNTIPLQKWMENNLLYLLPL